MWIWRKTKRCNRKSVGNKESLCEIGDKRKVSEKKTLDSNVFVSSQVPSPKIETKVISPAIEDESEEELSLLPANRA